MAKKAVSTRKTTRKKAGNQTIYIGLGVIGLGAALAFANSAQAAKIKVVQEPSVPSKKPTGSTTPEATPKPSIPAVPVDTSDGLYRDTSKSHVFIDSWDGESIWGKIDTDRWASMAVYDNIGKVFNNAYLGKLTGRTHSQSLWDWIEVAITVDGVLRKFWVDKGQTKLMAEHERDSYLKGGGGALLSDFHLDAIRRYFK